MKHNRLTQTLLIIAMAICLLLMPGQIQRASASRIVAVVNGAVITDFDITQRRKLERLLSGGKRNLGSSAALNLLIEDKLKLFEARSRKMTATDGEIDAAYGNMARNVKMTQKRMTGIFRQAGVNPQTVKDWLKVQISWRSLIRARFNAEVHVEEAAIIAALSKGKEKKDVVENAIQFDLTQITFVTRAKASSREANQKLTEAKRFRSHFASCSKDLAAARKLRDVAVSHIGRRMSTELHPSLVKRLRDTKINGLTAPTKVDNGYEMLAVCGKKDLGKQAAMRNEAETELKDKQSKELSRKYLQELRAAAIIDRR